MTRAPGHTSTSFPEPSASAVGAPRRLRASERSIRLKFHAVFTVYSFDSAPGIVCRNSGAFLRSFFPSVRFAFAVRLPRASSALSLIIEEHDLRILHRSKYIERISFEVTGIPRNPLHLVRNPRGFVKGTREGRFRR